MEELGSTRKLLEALDSAGKHKEAPISTGKHQEALGNLLEVMKSTRKHLAVLGRNPKEWNHWEAIRIPKKH